MKVMRLNKNTPALTVLRDQERSKTGDVRRKEDKSRGDGWWVDGGSSSVKTPHSRKWNQFPPGFPEAVPHESSSSLSPASTKRRTARPASPWHLTTRVCEEEYIETAEKDMLVHYFIYTVQRASPSQRGKTTWLHTGKQQDGWMSGRAWNDGKK